MFQFYLLGRRFLRLGALAASLALLAPAAAWAQAPTVIHLEAEDATIKGPGKLTDTPGYAGTGYVGNFEDTTDSLIFSFPAQASCYRLTIRYTSSEPNNRTTSVRVNGNPPVDYTLAPTGAAFASASAGTYLLAAGTTKVAIGAGGGYYGIDYIELTPAETRIVPLVNGRAEAEAGVLSGVTVATTPTGFSGAGFVTGFVNENDAKNVEISFNLPSAGLYQLSVGHTSPFGFKVANVTVNDSKSTVSFPGTTAAVPFSTADAGTVLLPAGLNTVTIGGNYGYYGIDYIQLTPATVALPAKPTQPLSDPLATPATKGLYTYLTQLYGTKVLAGQQDDQYGRSGSEIAYVLATTGKEPAIASMDLYDYSSAPVAKYGTPNGTTERFLTWARSGNGRGITSLIWHWRAPADLVTSKNPSGSPDGAFYTENTNFDIAAVLADKSGTRYQQLLGDIDLIAAQLQKFQAAGVPVLWRPLHESPGTFFWWGAKGPAAFKELWHVLYDRLVNYNHLHNLLWVYSANDLPAADWYPGDAYVDITGDDVYQSSAKTDPMDNISGKWAAMQAQFAPRKLVALTESESLVNPDQVRGYATWWSWFCAWQGSYIRSQPTAFLNSLYKDPDILTKDELADWYALGPLAARSGAAAVAAGLTVFPNPTHGAGLTVRLDLPAAQAADVELLNALGQRVRLLRTRLQVGANELQLPVEGVGSGLYQLVVRLAGQPALSQRVAISE